MVERSPGHWRLQVMGDPDPVNGDKQRLSRTFIGTRTEAREELQRLVVAAGAGLQGGSTTTVAALLEQFVTTAQVSPTTAQDWRSVINHHLIPELGDLPLWRLNARDCDRLYRKMASTGLGQWRVRNAHVVLHRSFAQAVCWGWIPRNPVSAANRPEVARTVIVPPTPEQVRMLLRSAERADQELACWLHVAVATGARRGEICALRWGDIDWERATVRIERSVSVTKQAGVTVKSTKTGGVRLVSITKQSVQALQCHRDRANGRAVECRRPVGRDDQVFTRDPRSRQPIRPELITRRWERLRKANDLDHVRIHDIRHFVATELQVSPPGSTPVPSRIGSATPVPLPPSTSIGRSCQPETATPPTISRP